ncbi:MAG: hypothetical protein PUJ79_01800, partial [Helicobacter sp.]|nr:hypothetical protein [Helicobacter sp.]MDY5740742.1 hypothetical protein [Helicobacter sp.]
FKNEKLISAQNAVAIKIESNKEESNPNGYYDGSIGTFINEGTIKATGNAIAIEIERKMQNGYGGSIGTFINETNGTISAEGQGAVSLAHATITSYDNEGTIKGGNYVCFLWLSLAHSDINALLCI